MWSNAVAGYVKLIYFVAETVPAELSAYRF